MASQMTSTAFGRTLGHSETGRSTAVWSWDQSVAIICFAISKCVNSERRHESRSEVTSVWK
eukprot:2508619-Alexandrium_andersonii.AAC.1